VTGIFPGILLLTTEGVPGEELLQLKIETGHHLPMLLRVIYTFVEDHPRVNLARGVESMNQAGQPVPTISLVRSH
jgi:hypothetical protein